MKKIYIFALILALVAGVAVYMFATSLEEKAKPAEIPTTTVVMAAADIPEGAYITADMLKLSAVPTAYVLSGAFTDAEKVIGMVNKYKCLANTQIVASQLGSSTDAKLTEGGRLSYTIKEGMRAITVSVNPVTGVAGFISEGDSVDIICFETRETGKKDADGEALTDEAVFYLLENVTVLNVGDLLTNATAEATASAEGESAATAEANIEYSLVTLEVTPEDALYLSLHETMGTLRFVLRNINDSETSTAKPQWGDASLRN